MKEKIRSCSYFMIEVCLSIKLYSYILNALTSIKSFNKCNI